VKQALWFNGDIYSTKLTGRQTGGQIGLVEATVPPGGGPAPHVHERTDETFYVVKALCAFLRLSRVGPRLSFRTPRSCCMSAQHRT
jgi:hypothetical protein